VSRLCDEEQNATIQPNGAKMAPTLHLFCVNLSMSLCQSTGNPWWHSAKSALSQYSQRRPT